MGAFTVERYHDICAGHRVHGHESKCAHLHGHNYRIHFKCVAMPPKAQQNQRNFIGMQRKPTQQNFDGLDQLGRVVDFSVVKATLCEWVEQNWDHKFLIWAQDPGRDALMALDPDGVVIVDFNPTAENMARFLVEYVGPQLLDSYNIALIECRIEETRKCSATYGL